jgi:uncharacterized protein (DUF58 family)
MSFLIGIIVTLVTFYIAFIYASAAIGLLGFAEAFLVVSAIVFFLYYKDRINVSVRIPIAVADPESRVNVCIESNNESPVPCMKIRYRILYGNTLIRKMHRKWLAGDTVYPGRNRYQNQICPKHAGNYIFEVEKIRIYDMTGLFHINRKINRSAHLQILPELIGVEVRVSERTRNFYGEAETYDDFRPGDDASETFEIRSFRAGDRMQSVHWKLSAKSEELLVRENSQPLACAVVLFLDRGQKRYSAGTAECFLSVAANLVFSLVGVSCPHYVAWYSGSRGEIVRIRVDDEESYYLFLNFYLEDSRGKAPMDLRELYKEKYRYDHAIHQLILTPELKLYQNDNVIAEFTEKGWKDTLTNKLEILL